MNKTVVGKPLAQLEPLVGQWRVEVALLGKPQKIGGRYSFEWWGDRTFLLQRSTMDHPDFPDSICVIGATGPDGRLALHYFDSRSVQRVLDMTFEKGVWTLSRKGGAGDFDQRYVGKLSVDGKIIAGAWEKTEPGRSEMKHDFDITLTRLESGRA